MITLKGAEIILDMFIMNDRNSRYQEIVVASPFEARSIVLSISANAEIIKHPIFNLIQSYTSIGYIFGLTRNLRCEKHRQNTDNQSHDVG